MQGVQEVPAAQRDLFPTAEESVAERDMASQAMEGLGALQGFNSVVKEFGDVLGVAGSTMGDVVGSLPS